MTWQPGTALKNSLGSIGITPERYSALKAAVGLPEECNCVQRAEWLNKAWAWAVSQNISQPARLPKRKCFGGKPRSYKENLQRVRALQQQHGEL